ncbi:MAG: hypothetical protein FWC73_03195 [Defluviitaleaceae bacterium]|nr:hypothetical protein [Defluviitaleaceae bacterium]
MKHIRYKLKGNDFNGAHHRWVQPPQVSYFVTTIDKHGNTNVTPTTMGTCIGQNYFSFTFSNRNIKDWDLDIHPYQEGIKQGYANLRDNPECVISYYGHAKVIHTHKLGDMWTHYICEVIAITVHEELVDKNENGPLPGYGIMLADPLFEVYIGRGTTPETESWRLEYARLNMDTLERCPEYIGCKDHWTGTFSQWIHEEADRGKLTSSEVKRALELEALWAKNPHPIKNAAVKSELTQLLIKAVKEI